MALMRLQWLLLIPLGRDGFRLWRCVHKQKNGMVEVGPFDTKAELLEALEDYCENLIADGEMTKTDVEQLLAHYE